MVRERCGSLSPSAGGCRRALARVAAGKEDAGAPSAFSKFAEVSAEAFDETGARFTLTFGKVQDFIGGLEKLVGEPYTHRFDGMHAEHVEQPDSNTSFTAGELLVALYSWLWTKPLLLLRVVQTRTSIPRCTRT